METNRLQTGYNGLDELNVLEKGKLTIVASRPAVGKTTFCLNVFTNLILHREKGILFTFDDFADSLIEKIKIAKVIENDETLEYIKDMICDSAFKFKDILDVILRNRDELGISFIVVDDLSVLRKHSDYVPNDPLKVLKQMAQELGIAVISTYNTTQNAKKHISLKNTADGTAFNISDSFIFLYRPELYATAEELTSGNIKHGIMKAYVFQKELSPKGCVDLIYDTKNFRIEDNYGEC